MYDLLRTWMLRWLKVPPEPHPPQGDPASLRIFRAGRNYYRLRMATWGVGQVFALIGILFWTGMLLEVERVARAEKASPTALSRGAPRADDTVITPAGKKQHRQARFDQWRDQLVKNVTAAAQEPGSRPSSWWAGTKRLYVELALVMPTWVFPIAWALKIIGLLIYFAQLAVSYVARRLDYEMRWYLVTDRSLRLRHGVWVVWETTMSFSNIQQVIVSQGPLQRLLGLANVKVESAGGSGGRDHEKTGEDMHVGYFHSVTNAEEIRDLILQRLRQFRESGLGDPDEKPAPISSPAGAPHPLLAAAREFAAEARALRHLCLALDRPVGGTAALRAETGPAARDGSGR